MGTLNIFEERSDVVIGKPGGRPSEGSRLDLKWLALLHCGALCQSHSESFVHDRFEWTPSSPRFSLKADGNIIVKGQCGSHASRCYL
jgi:hypothetical protein